MKFKDNKFSKYFNLILEQEDIALQATSDDDEQALQQGLDPETNPEDFDVEPKPLEPQVKVIQKLEEYINKIEEFSTVLNGDGDVGESLNKYINEVDREGSVLQGISRESNKVTTVAENLASLAEAFRGQLLVAMRKQREKEAVREEY